MIYLSWGCGLQSTTVLVMSALGLRQCPRIDYAIFADTQDEPLWVYQTLTTYAMWVKRHGIEVVKVSKGSLSQAIQQATETGSRVASIPAWTMGTDGREAILMRQCTREWKIEPIWREVRRLAGLRKGQRAKGEFKCLLGISTDEADRMKPSRIKAVENVYPLIDARMSERDCIDLLTSLELPIPKKSSCVYCPYHSDRYWRELKTSHAEEFAKACAMDNTIRDMSKRGVNGQLFLHRSLKPLVQIEFGRQGEMFSNECEGHCGI